MMAEVDVAGVSLWGMEIGALAWNPEKKVGEFQYTPEFLDTPFELAPLKMPKSPRVYGFPGLNEETFKGLPGMLADSLPDRFGNQLINAWLARQGRKPNSFNPVERLCYVGRRGMGALEYTPASGPRAATDAPIAVEELVRLSNKVLSDRGASSARLDEEIDEAAMQQILQVGTSVGGARAKAIIAWNEKTGEVRSGQLDLGEGFGHWILKLDGITENQDKEGFDPQGYCAREYVYYLMAREAGMEMAECRLMEENGRRHFLTRRFDRAHSPTGPGERVGDKIFMQSLCALGHYDYNTPGSVSYDELFLDMEMLGLGRAAAQEQFRRLVFNVLAMNRDDHTKNTSFLMDKAGQWRLSPAYDVTFAFNPAGDFTSEHQMTINGKADGITRADLEAIAKRAGVSRQARDRIIDQVIEAVTLWPALSEEYGVPEALIKEADQGLALARRSFLG
ncbi:type II toxin-antitoxin system HipA family toxin [Alloalcanivorax sp. C16-1]